MPTHRTVIVLYFRGINMMFYPQAVYDSRWHRQLMGWLAGLTLEDEVRWDLRGGTGVYHGYSGSGFVTQDRAASECVVATSRSGGGNLGMQGHDTGYLSFPI